MQVKLAKQAGYCYGVERALKLTDEAIKENKKPIFTLGPIIHNPQVVDSLRKQGVEPIEGIDKVKSGTIILRTHGVDPLIVKEAKGKGLDVVDATCPFVAKAQRRAAALMQEGRTIVIVGERNHPEVEALLACVSHKAVVIENVSDLKGIRLSPKVGVVVQTTQSEETLKQIVAELVIRTQDLKVFNTICHATGQRQKAAVELAKHVDIMLVVGGKNSANTTRLAKLCIATGTPTYHIETFSEIKNSWLNGVGVVGVTAGASTPDWILKEVVDYLEKFSGE
jgi:4-hydroxy-3-methylbut-2-enyl diphosphate reductase